MTTTTRSPSQAMEYFESKVAFTTGPVELERMIRAGDDNLVIVDVRAAEDFERGHIPGAVNLPQDKWETLADWHRDKFNVIYCYSQTCHLAAKAALVLAGKGCTVMEMEGGFESWRGHDFEIEHEPVNRMNLHRPSWLHWRS